MTRKPLSKFPSTDCLSFVSYPPRTPKGEPRPPCFWNIRSTGDRYRDEVIGQHLALEYLDYEERLEDGPGFMPMIVRSMPRELTGIEIGFLTLISYAAKAGAFEARRVAAYWADCRKDRELAAARGPRARRA